MPRAARPTSDIGAVSLSVALLTPLFVVLAFAAVQAALWSHARTEARVVARDAAVLVARAEVGAGDAQASAEAILRSDTDLVDVDVTIASGTGVVTVTVSGRAPGILRGTSVPVEVTEALPFEELTR